MMIEVTKRKVDQNKKSTISKLLATENIHVVHRKTKTASFNVATRELTLPIFKKELSNDVYDMFVCHEVGHALWTPLDMLDKIKKHGIDKSVVNVIEDARIEKMIQKKYPGSVSNFKKGYQELLKDNFFGIKNKDLSKENIIDKINIYFKTGLDVGFTSEEKKLADMVDKCKTPQDVLDLAVLIAGYHKDKKKKEDQENLSKVSTKDNGKDNNVDSEDSEYQDDNTDEDTENETKKPDDSKDEDDKDDTEEKNSTNAESMSEGGQDKGLTDLRSATDRFSNDEDNPLEEIKKGINKLINENAKDNNYVELPSKINLKELVVNWKKVLKDWTHEYWNQDGKEITDGEKTWKKYMDKHIIDLYNENKKVVSYMVKEFEMKKSADQYNRAWSSKTGMLDMSKVHTYKYNDDLFAKMTTIPGATNHGFIMYLDWSGSMAYNMRETLKQLYNLIWFCQRTKIPYQVLAFSDHYQYDSMGERKSMFRFNHKEQNAPIIQKPVHNEINLDGLRLLEFFNSDMNKEQTQTMMKYLLGFGYYWGGRYDDDYIAGDCLSIPSRYNLGGTPLDHAILTMPTIIDNFNSKNKVQKTNVIILSDGDSHGSNNKFTLSSEGWKFDDGGGYDSQTIITDKKSGKTMKYDYNWRGEPTENLLKFIKMIKPNITITGFFLAGTGRHGRVSLRTIEHKFKVRQFRDKDKIIAIQKELRKHKVAVCKTQGYDEYYILPTPKLKDSEDLVIKPNAKTSGIKSAFIKSMNAKTVNRQLLNKFIGMVA